MGLKLTVVRHAKSERQTAAGTDHARCLEPRGHDEAVLLAKKLAGLKLLPDKILCSDAVRTQQTCSHLTDVMGCSAPVHVTRALYAAPASVWLNSIGEQSSEIEQLILVGHNPGLEALIAHLSSQEVLLATANAGLLSTQEQTWSTAVARPGLWQLDQLVTI